MRQRKVKDLDRKLQAVRRFMADEGELGRRELFPEEGPSDEGACFPEGRSSDRGGLYVEIGCGKGDFLLQQALAHPEADFIGIEGQASVVLRAAEKAARIEAGTPAEEDPEWMRRAPEGTQLRNLRFACAFVERLQDLFGEGSLAGIYLNFSDPWPKGRHAKRRLTYRGRLMDYGKVLRPGGFIAFKTDNRDLFDFTLEEIAACGWTPSEMTRDLHGPDCEYEARQIMTEYERKFHAAGRQIHYVKVEIGDRIGEEILTG